MQKVIKESGLTIKEFSELYEIPYNTVRQWANGTRQAPKWLVRIFKAEQAYKPLIEEVKEDTSLISEEGIRRTVSIFEYIIYFKGQNGAFIKVPVDMLIEQFKGITENLRKEVTK